MKKSITEVRRYGWLRNYHHDLDQGDRVLDSNDDSQQSYSSNMPPININVNINLGDLLKQVVSGVRSTKEALEEIVKTNRKRIQLNESKKSRL